MQLKILMRDDCKLCDEAMIQVKLAIEEFNSVSYETINIDYNDTLQETYMLRIPVVMHETHIIQEGIIDFFTIYEYIDDYFIRKDE